MILPGEDAADPASVDAVADATVGCFLRVVPAAVPGIAFLSGGQPSKLASAHLNAMNVRFRGRMPWALAFSFARAIQQPALEIWRGRRPTSAPRSRRSSIAPTAIAPPAAANTTPAPTRRAPPPERIEELAMTDTRSTSNASTRFASSRSTWCSRPTAAIPGCRSAPRRWPTCCGRAS